MKIKFNLVMFLFLIVNGCTNSTAVKTSEPEIDLVSTFDVSLDMENQKNLESQFDSVLDPQNLDKWMKHMSSTSVLAGLILFVAHLNWMNPIKR